MPFTLESIISQRPKPYPASPAVPRLAGGLGSPAQIVAREGGFRRGIAIDRYNRVIGQFYQEQQMDVAGDWSDHSAQRLLARKTGRGGKRLSEALKNLGFPLL